MPSTTKKPQSNLLRPFGHFIQRFHLILFFIFVAALVAAAVMLINKALTEPTQEEYTSTINAGSIDQATLERIQSLQTSNQPPATVQLPEGRINPFAE